MPFNRFVLWLVYSSDGGEWISLSCVKKERQLMSQVERLVSEGLKDAEVSPRVSQPS